MAKKSTWYGPRARAVMRAALMEALHEGAEIIRTEVLTEIPHATGTMQRSGTVTDAPTEGAVYISYDTPYAVRQHEDLTLLHPDPRNPISSPGRKAKYLEDPFNRLKPRIMALVRKRMTQALQSTK